MSSPRVTVVVGGQYGDEGKGKFVHYLVHKEKIGIVARGNGGPNAGHNVHDPARGLSIALHLMPSGISSESAINIVGCGTVVNPQLFVEEIESVRAAGVKLTPDNLKLSSRAHIILQGHRALDGALDKVGSTRQGIGLAYRDKAVRIGLRLESMLRDTFTEEITALLERHNVELDLIGATELGIDVQGEVQKLQAAAAALRPFICDTVSYISDAVAHGTSVLVEGAQATLLDINYGTYPYVTSSGATASGILAGLAISPRHADRIIGVFKLPMTRVGKGPFVTRLTDQESELHSVLAGKKGTAGAEFGATTGRARDIGWMDLVAARYAQAVNGFTELGLTKLDTLSGIGKLKVATAYQLDGKTITVMPSDTSLIERCQPIYTELDGWDESIAGVREFDDLPRAAQDYIAFIERAIGVPATMIGTGPNNDDMIVRRGLE